jgi:hypothetical protein
LTELLVNAQRAAALAGRWPARELTRIAIRGAWSDCLRPEPHQDAVCLGLRGRLNKLLACLGEFTDHEYAGTAVQTLRLRCATLATCVTHDLRRQRSFPCFGSPLATHQYQNHRYVRNQDRFGHSEIPRIDLDINLSSSLCVIGSFRYRNGGLFYLYELLRFPRSGFIGGRTNRASPYPKH